MEDKKKKQYKMKFENRFSVSYSKDLYLRARILSVKMGTSIQDVQRMAMDRFLNETEKEATHV